MVYVSKPSNVTGVTLTNPASVDGTYALDFDNPSNAATGGNIVYTDSSGLNPTLTPDANTYYVVHKFNDMTVIGSLGEASISFNRAKDIEVLLVGGGASASTSTYDCGGCGAGGFRLLNKSVTAKTYNLHIGAGGEGHVEGGATPPNEGPGITAGYTTIWDVDGDADTAAFGGDRNTDGGSGSGGIARFSGGWTITPPTSGNTPPTVPSQGNDGGTAVDGTNTGKIYTAYGAGGGGAGSAGYPNSGYEGGAGGDGITSNISGVPTVYAAGGGGGAGAFNGFNDLVGGDGGSGGVGGHGHAWSPNDVSFEESCGAPWTGSGGGGVTGMFSWTHGHGGCGIIIVRYVYDKATLSWGGGTPVNITGNGTYSLSDGSGNSIDAVVVFASLPSSSQTDNIVICNIPIITNAATSVLSTSFLANGEIFVSGATTRGYCYKLSSISGDPTVADSKVNETGSFVAEEYDLPVTGVLKETEYKVAAYMIIDGDTYYGDTELVHTPFGSLYIAITPVDEIIDLGETQQYTVTSYQDDGSTLDVTDLCTYTSSDTNVATISNDPATIGLATATSTVISTPDWNYGTGWSVIGGYAIHTGETSGLMISGMVTEIEATLTVYEGTFTDATDLIVTFFTSGGNYTIQFYVTGMGTGASVTPYIGATAGVAVTESGCHVQNLVAPATGRYLKFDATGTLAIQRVLIFVEKNFTASTEQTELPSQYQHLMVLYATACGLNKDKKFQSAQVTELMYNNELNYVKTNLEDIVPDSKKDLRR